MPEINIPPGVVKTLSNSTAVGRVVDMDKVRFYNSKPQKIGGWTRLNSTPLIGIPRSLYAYAQANRREVKIAGTESRLYALDTNNVVTDITPYRATHVADAGTALSTSDGSSTITVTDPAHSAEEGDRILISPAQSVGGITVSGEYTVTLVIDANNYTIEDTEEATSSSSVAGPGFSINYYIDDGVTSMTEGHGYGTGPYGIDSPGEAYGTARLVTGNAIPPRYWSLDNYGTWGLFCYQGGLVYKWDEEASDRPQAWVGSPTDALYAFVTPERFIFVLCDDMVLRWPDRDNPEDWTATPENTANVRTLGTGSHLIAGCRLSGVSLIFSDTAVYSAQYTGGNSIYATDLIGTNCGLVGPGAFCHEGGVAYWFGCASFHMYAGQIQPIPNQDNILAWMLDNLDPASKVKMTCWYNPQYREVWWTFPSRNSVEPDLYVAVSLIDFEWIHGTLDRLGATQQSQKSRLPILSSFELDETTSLKWGWLYEHDQIHNKNANGEALDWHYQVGLWRIPEAAQSVDIFGFAPDFEEQVGTIALDVQAQDRPQSTNIDNEVKFLPRGTELSDLRVAGRYFSYRLSQTGIIDGDFRDGTHILEVQGAGSRR